MSLATDNKFNANCHTHTHEHMHKDLYTTPYILTHPYTIHMETYVYTHIHIHTLATIHLHTPTQYPVHVYSREVGREVGRE